MPPRRKHCGGAFLKPTVVLFGEPMPAEATQEAFELASRTDVMLVVGTSLVVYPAADVPLLALRSGARMLVANADPPPFHRLPQALLPAPSAPVPPPTSRL